MSLNLVRSPEQAYVRPSEGAGTTTLTSADNKWQIFNLSANRICVLPSADIKAGEVVRVENVGSGKLTIQSSGLNQVGILDSLYATCNMIALVDSPSTAAHWRNSFSYAENQYLHGTSYSGGNAPTLSGSSWTTTRAAFVPYQMQDGTWRMRWNARGILSGLANNNFFQLTINGATFKNVTDWQQAFSLKVDSGTLTSFISGYATPNSSLFTFIYNGASVNLNDDWTFSGDVELESKPSWAY